MRNIIVLGAGEAGDQISKLISLNNRYNLKAILDDNPGLDRIIAGVQVRHTSELEELINNYQVDEIIIAISNISEEQYVKLVNKIKCFTGVVKKVPNLKMLSSNALDLNHLNSVLLENRNEKSQKSFHATENLSGRSVLVTGGAGSIGSELCRQLLMSNVKKLTAVDISEHSLYQISEQLIFLKDKLDIDLELNFVLADVKDQADMCDLLKRHKVDLVFHVAAYKHVNIAENNECVTFINNVVGTKVMLEACEHCSVKDFVLISTDKAVRPTNIMGATKRIAEVIANDFLTRGVFSNLSIVRFGNVIGSSGSVIPKFISQIRSGGPVSVTHPEVTRYFMSVEEAVSLIVGVNKLSGGGSTFHLDMGQPLKIVDVAEKLIIQEGYNPVISATEITPIKRKNEIIIKFTGLMKGEKLYEELLIDGEQYVTENERIFRCGEVGPSKAEKIVVSKLLKGDWSRDDASVRALLEPIMIEL